MKNNQRGLAFQLRRARRLYHGRGMARKTAAAISGVSGHTIRRYESARRLPAPVRVLLRLAKTYHVTLDALIAESVVKKAEEAVEIARARRDACAQ